MIVKMFKPRFAPLVRDGTKRQTIRPKPKRALKPNEEISLRQWEGKPYRSKQVELRKSTLTSLESIAIHQDGISFGDGTMRRFWCGDKGGRRLILEAFAKDDGFSGWTEMREWFQEEHGLPFEGTLYKWA